MDGGTEKKHLAPLSDTLSMTGAVKEGEEVLLHSQVTQTGCGQQVNASSHHMMHIQRLSVRCGRLKGDSVWGHESSTTPDISVTILVFLFLHST